MASTLTRETLDEEAIEELKEQANLSQMLEEFSEALPEEPALGSSSRARCQGCTLPRPGRVSQLFACACMVIYFAVMHHGVPGADRRLQRRGGGRMRGAAPDRPGDFDSSCTRDPRTSQ